MGGLHLQGLFSSLGVVYVRVPVSCLYVGQGVDDGKGGSVTTSGMEEQIMSLRTLLGQ